MNRRTFALGLAAALVGCAGADETIESGDSGAMSPPPPPPPSPPSSCCDESTGAIANSFSNHLDSETISLEEDSRTIGRQYGGAGAMYPQLRDNYLSHVEGWISDVEADTRNIAASHQTDPAAIHDLVNEYRAKWDDVISEHFDTSSNGREYSRQTIAGMNERMDSFIYRLQAAGLSD